MNPLILSIILLTVTGLIIIFLYNIINKNAFYIPDIYINRNLVKVIDPIVVQKPSVNQLHDFYKDIKIEPYGCFSELDEKFFQKQLNPYTNTFDSLIIINDNSSDVNDLIDKVNNNGYDIYANNIKNKYPDITKISIQEIATLGKLLGYNISIYKINKNKRGKIYLSYSPPMDEIVEEYSSKNLTKSDLPDYTLTPKLNNYTNEIEKEKGKELSCGYPCLQDENPDTFVKDNVTKQYMCGSVGYPNIKTSTRFSVYKIIETI